MAKKPPKDSARAGRRRHQRPLPICNAFLICEKIIWDSIAIAPTLVSLFSQFNVHSLPAYLNPFWLFLQVADGIIGDYSIEIEIQDLDRGELVHKFAGPSAIFRYRPEVFNTMIQVPPIRVEHPSRVYAVVAFADGKVLAQQKFTVQIHGSSHEQPNH